MTIFPIHAFKDNYIWAWVDESSQQLWVVDPGDARPVGVALKTLSLNLGGILLTHHHHDHSGGIAALMSDWLDIRVIGAKVSPIASLTERVQEGDSVHCGGIELKVLAIPGHTLDHIAFFNDHVLFCGDTLFSAGCGRVFEGTSQQMYDSLQKLARLSAATLLYCGHEYTEANLHFALAIEPNNLIVQKKLTQVQALRSLQKSTLPASLAEELNYNPFLRCTEPGVIKAAEGYAQAALKTPHEVFAVLRALKNNFTF